MPLWTPERRELLGRLWAEGRLAAEIIPQLNELPGPPLSNNDQLQWMARKLKVRRPASFLVENGKRYGALGAAARCGKAPPVPVDYVPQPRTHTPRAAPEPPARAKLTVPERIVRQWGATLGLPLDNRGDVAAVNAAIWAEDPSHPGFRIEERSWTTGTFRMHSE